MLDEVYRDNTFDTERSGEKMGMKLELVHTHCPVESQGIVAIKKRQLSIVAFRRPVLDPPMRIDSSRVVRSCICFVEAEPV